MLRVHNLSIFLDVMFPIATVMVEKNQSQWTNVPKNKIKSHLVQKLLCDTQTDTFEQLLLLDYYVVYFTFSQVSRSI